MNLRLPIQIGWLVLNSRDPAVSASPALGWQVNTAVHGSFYMDAGESTLSSSCFCANHFIDWAISLILHSFYGFVSAFDFQGIWN